MNKKTVPVHDEEGKVIGEAVVDPVHPEKAEFRIDDPKAQFFLRKHTTVNSCFSIRSLDLHPKPRVDVAPFEYTFKLPDHKDVPEPRCITWEELDNDHR